MSSRNLKKHRGITPAIATLVVILVAVIGGMGTLVFAQEVFNLEQVAFEPKIESARIVGFDARDSTELITHNGFATSENSAGTPDGKISKSERLGVYFQNDSTDEIWIDELRFAGKVYTYSGEVQNISDLGSGGAPGPGEFVILADSDNTSHQLGVLAPGELATLVLGIDDNLKVGRAAQVKITTTNDWVTVGRIGIGDYISPTHENSESISFAMPLDPEEDPGYACTTVAINFDADPHGNDLPAGMTIQSQWHAVDVHISADNNKNGHPDEVITFDSNNPTGGDGDLGAPWPFGNIEPDENLENLLIIAEDNVDADGDGLVDDPDDEAKGGIIFIDSLNSHCYLSFDLIDIEQTEGNSGYIVIKLEGGGDVVYNFNDFAGTTYANNSANRIHISAAGIGGTFNQVEFHLDGSGAINNVILG